MATLNMKKATWLSQHCRPTYHYLVTVMREKGIEIAGLSEMAADQDALSIAALEEFVMLAQGRVRFILTPHLFSAWKLAGEVVHYCDGWMLITVKVAWNCPLLCLCLRATSGHPECS